MCEQMRPEQLVHEKKRHFFYIYFYYFSMLRDGPPSQAVDLASFLCCQLRNICKLAAEYVPRYKYKYPLALERECKIVYLCRTYLLYKWEDIEKGKKMSKSFYANFYLVILYYFVFLANALPMFAVYTLRIQDWWRYREIEVFVFHKCRLWSLQFYQCDICDGINKNGKFFFFLRNFGIFEHLLSKYCVILFYIDMIFAFIIVRERFVNTDNNHDAEFVTNQTICLILPYTYYR